MHASRIRTAPSSGPIDRRRLVAAGLSAIIPGLGQASNRRRRLALLFLVPSLIVAAVVGIILGDPDADAHRRLGGRPRGPRRAADAQPADPAWRLLAVGQAFLDTRHHGPTGRLGIVGIAIIALLVLLPHAAVYRYGTAFGDAFARIFDEKGLAADGPVDDPGPAQGERVNVLVLGLDAAPGRTAVLTDTMMVVSFDPVGKTASMVSLPRDLVNVPLGNGDDFGPKLNSLMAYADNHPDDFPKGGLRTLQDAAGALLGIPIHYYATMEFEGFISMVDAVGGVDVTVPKAIDDPGYDGFGADGRGWSITKGDPPPRRRERAGLRAQPEVGRRERLHPGRPTTADHRRTQGRGDRGRQRVLGAASAARRRRATRSGPTCRSSACRSWRRRWTRWDRAASPGR